MFFYLAKFNSWIDGGHLYVDKSARFRVPVRVDGLGVVLLSDRVVLGYHKAPRLGRGTILLQAREKKATITIGSGTKLSNNVSLTARKYIDIGKCCLIGDYVAVLDHDGHEVCPSKRNEGAGRIEGVTIRDNVWIGSRVQIMKGVTIGEGAVVAAGAVVVKDLPANAVAAGVPAKVLYSI